MVVSVTALVCLKSIRNIIAPPMVIVTDCKEVSFRFPTRFKSKLVSMNYICMKFLLHKKIDFAPHHLQTYKNGVRKLQKEIRYV